jgi:hypothetical protein
VEAYSCEYVPGAKGSKMHRAVKVRFPRTLEDEVHLQRTDGRERRSGTARNFKYGRIWRLYDV